LKIESLFCAKANGMNKKILLRVVIFMIALSGIYIIIPSTITVSKPQFIHSYEAGIIRFFSDSTVLNRWLQKVAVKSENGYDYKGYQYQISKNLGNTIEINIYHNNETYTSRLAILPIYGDSSAIHLESNIISSFNPIKRVQQYNQATALKENITDFTKELKTFLDENKNIYGIHVSQIALKDSLLISTKTILSNTPSVEQVYAEVKKLADYANAQKANATDSAMLHVEKINDKQFQIMVGLPIDKIIPETNQIKIKRMPYGKSMLVSNIDGGLNTIAWATNQLYTYWIDTKRASPAIPFEMMITNRLVEKDSTKWKTRLFYPVM
jgi:effector-binding domain-containing protein